MAEDSIALYDRRGPGYGRYRQPDPNIAAHVHYALSTSRTVVNVGAGTGSYEPSDRYVLAVEPSAAMRGQRPPLSPPAIEAIAEDLPLDDDSVDAAMAVLTVHHWSDQRAGLHEMRRVARGPVVVLTFDAEVKRRFWLLSEYLPETAELDERIFPTLGNVLGMLGGGHIERVRIPASCQDGFLEAFWARPELYLDPAVRQVQSGWGRLAPGVEGRVVDALAQDLASGLWDQRHGELREATEYDGGLRLVVSPGAPCAR